ncbi:MFS transporter [Albimonas sp. CAU 1670]|uniref:MFS transporter n=1 Tax=Albimonas sp. CAU 1670 TaxID=3032599 RepID=UPI0023DA0157|nr:MFS transporter [Albimonas sp. CAU 1670]MDF2232001.1 MFS transporter [Albimonas sp. CAU 1670]
MSARADISAPSRAAAPAEPGTATMLALLAASSLTIMASTVISPGLPGMEAHFADTPDAAMLTRLAVTLPGLLVAIFAPVAGALADRLGRRRILISAMVLYVLSGMSGLLLDTLPAILVGRAMLGVAVAGVLTSASAMAGDLFRGEAQARFMGRQASAMGAAGLVFLTGGGLLAELHWRAPFGLYGIALLVLLAALVLLPETRNAQARAQAAAEDDGAPAPWGTLAVLYALGLGTMVTMYVMPVQLPFRLREMGLDAPSQAGLALGVFTLMSSVSALGAARLRGRMGPGGMFAVSFLMLGAGFAWVSLSSGLVSICLGGAVAGAAMGLTMPNLFGTVVALAPARIRGRATGGMTSAVFLGQFVSPLLSQPAAETWGYAGAFLAAAALTPALALLALLARRSFRA